MPQRPQASEYASFQAAYVALVPEEDILGVLASQCSLIEDLVSRVTPEREAFRYAPGKWSLRQIFGHLGDAERIFGYRALCIAREGKEALPPFDENLFVATGGFDQRTIANLAEELLLLRRANLSMFRGLEERAWSQTCIANGTMMTTQAIAWVIAGHMRHHVNILAERYQLSASEN